MQPRRARSVRLAGYKACATVRLSKTAVNDRVLVGLERVAEGACCLVTNYGRWSLTDSVKLRASGRDFSFPRLRRPIQTRRPRVDELADQSSGAEE
jgi:hypothetical protein